MPIEILMPALSPTMSEGGLARWLKKEGDTVKSGDVLAEIETDKATMEFEAVDEGVLGKILVQGGTSGVAVNTPIALLLEEGEDASALKDYSAQAPKKEEAVTGTAPQETKTGPKESAPVKAAEEKAPAAKEGRVFATPLARRLAKNADLDIASVKGTGPRGRIVKADVLKAVEAGKNAPAASTPASAAPKAAAPAAPPAFGPAFTEIPNSGMRKTIARRLSESKQTVPHFYLTVECEIDELLKTRKELNTRLSDGKLSVNDFIIRAAALALRKVPEANASWTDAAIRRYDEIDVSVAVATDGGLITPIIKNADRKGLAEISHDMKELAGKARDGKLKPEEYQGGGFTISNLGMYGVHEFAAIINPPQSAIMAIGSGEQRPVVKSGALAIATMMNCTLSADHRVVDGAIGAQFMAAFKALIEDPLSMLL